MILDQSVSLEQLSAPPVAAIPCNKGLHDELSGQSLAVIEAVDGRV